MPVQPFQTIQNGAALGDDGAAKIGGDRTAPAAPRSLASSRASARVSAGWAMPSTWAARTRLP
jgi:hypothetical protein